MSQRKGHAVHGSLSNVVEERHAIVLGVVVVCSVVHFDYQGAWILDQ